MEKVLPLIGPVAYLRFSMRHWIESLIYDPQMRSHYLKNIDRSALLIYLDHLGIRYPKRITKRRALAVIICQRLSRIDGLPLTNERFWLYL